jgi:nitrite reductase/ring-hydroxylating ferredoxin subunit
MTSIGKQVDLPPGAVRVFQVGGRSVAVANVDNQLYAFDDVCTHRGCSLSDGSLNGIFITCPCHGSVFRVTDGTVAGGPAETDVEAYAVQVVDGEILVSVAGRTPAQDEAPTVTDQPPAAGGAAPQATAADPETGQGPPEPSPLAGVPLFAGLDQASLESLEAFTFRKTFDAGDLVVEEGRTGNGLYVVLSGKVEVVKGLGGPNPHVAAVLGPGEPFGEMALLGDWRRSASVRALEEVSCLGMDRWAFLAHLNREPQLAVRMLQMLAERLAQTNERLVE